MQPKLTDRLVLRSFSERDAEGLFRYLSRKQVNCFASDRIETMDQAMKVVEERQRTDKFIAVCLKETDELIGDLFLQKDEPDTYSVGWNFNADYQGKGYALESAKALLDYLFKDRGARRIYAYVEEDNIRSQKVCERLGMRKEGCFKEFITFINNDDGTPRYENTMQFAILSKEWDSTKDIDMEKK